MSNKKKLKPKGKRHYFFLSDYKGFAYTKCPKCKSKTLIRKFPLVIHIEPRQIFVLNKKCKYCTRCDLIIVLKPEVKTLMTISFEDKIPDIVGNNYLVMGTLEKSDWRARKNMQDDVEIIERMYAFREVWDFELIRPGWYREDEHTCSENNLKAKKINENNKNTNKRNI